jgi:tetratricopeptide (TPR) repeat protein
MIAPTIVYCLAAALTGQTPLPVGTPAASVESPSIRTPAAGLLTASTATPGAPRAGDALSTTLDEAKKLYKEKKYGESLTLFQKAAGLDPKNAEAYNGMGLCYHAQGKSDLAIESFQKSIERDPVVSTVYYNLGRAYGSKQQFDLAIIAYHKAIKKNPGYGFAHFELGNTYFLKKDFTKAKEHYEKAASIFGEKTYQGEQALCNAIKSEMFMQRLGK